MPTVNELNPKIDQVVRVFDTFYTYEITVEPGEYDAVSSYFESVFTDRRIAQNFTATLFRIADQLKRPALGLLAEIQGQDTITLSTTFCYYLNGLRSPSTLLGVNVPIIPNYWAARNVLL